MKIFKPTSWSIDNRTSIYVVTIIITLFGIYSYNHLQKEKFPDIVIPTVNVTTIYLGTSPAEMENLVTRPIEKQIKAVSGVKKIISSSIQDLSIITIQFNTDVAVSEAKQRIKDAIDKAQQDLPQNLTQEPNVQEINFSDFPIMHVNLSGDFNLDKLKKYADRLKDKIETLPEITRVEIVGARDKEVPINLDIYKMQVAKITFYDVVNAIKGENATISGGLVRVGDQQPAVRVEGEYVDAKDIGNIVVRSATGAPHYIHDLVTDSVRESDKEAESFARLDHKPVITLNIIKRSGENLISASDKIRDICAEMKSGEFPKGLNITITGDQSDQTRDTLKDLINTIIIGFILVTLILMFFMGTTNALFVAMSVPLSTFLAFLILPGIGFTLNMIVLFSFLLALGIVVDDAIVVIENTHRIFHSTKLTIVKSAKYAAGEVFVPVLAGTLTTLAPFFPLSFWPGIVGKFMYYLPVTLIITLIASLLVASIINPVFAVSFMRKNDPTKAKANTRRFWVILGILEVFAIFFYIGGNPGIGNFVNFLIVFAALDKYVFVKWINGFQNSVLPKFMRGYEKVLKWALYKRHPWIIMGSIIILFFFSIFLTAIRAPKVEFFPSGNPNFVYVYLNLPIGTDVRVTDSVTKILEQKVYSVIGQNNPDVESVITNVALSAGDPSDQTQTINATSQKAKIEVAFKELQYRKGIATQIYLDSIRDVIAAMKKPVPGMAKNLFADADITVDKEANGPPTGKPVNIEVSGDNFDTLINLSKRVKNYLNSLPNSGIENLQSNLQDRNPEINVVVDRERANREGITTAQIGNELRTAIFGMEASKFKDGEDQYPIQVRYSDKYRKNIDELMNMNITYREITTGQIRQVPISAVTRESFGTTFGAINRINLKRVVTLSSNVLNGYNANDVAANVTNVLKNLHKPDGYEIRLTGAQEDQKETGDFLGLALMLAIGLIFLILVTQFNSVSKPFIILSEILFSIIGVLLGFSIFKMTISIVMTGVGILALGGIVVKNGILLVEFSDELKERGHRTLDAIVQAGKTRLTPVLLTAMACMLGLIPLALGMNIDFGSLFSTGNPHFFLGGDSQVFWGPLAWTIIFGLSFATVLTLIVVPVMYLLVYKFKIYLKRKHILPNKRTQKELDKLNSGLEDEEIF